MHAPWAEWDHVLKVDPDKDLPAGVTYEEVCGTGTDAIAVGGTLGVTREKSQRVVDACRRHDVPIYQEPSNPTVIVDDETVEGYLVPIVLNAGDVFWVVGAHKEWARVDDVDWDRTTTEAYIVLNPEASAAELTEADCSLDAGDVAAYAEVAERMLGQRIVYVEYSGTFGDPETVAVAHDALESAALFYGGGIRDYDAAYEMRSHADTVVVGDLLHDEGVDAVRETVEGAKAAAAAEQPAD